MPVVTTIPATHKPFAKKMRGLAKRRKVAGYARVSTDHEEQQTSYEAQMSYYSEMIRANPEWEFVGMYSDEGITATNTHHREGFKSMIDDASAGKIDLILTKSVSRFARNTVDSLVTVRKLKAANVEVYFEKENIWTLDSKGELLITIMSSLAQEESRNISENTTWGHRKRFSEGKVSVPFGRFLGYDRGVDGKLVVNEKQAEVVKRIYREFLRGKTYAGIGKMLEIEGIPAPGGGNRWSKTTIRNILSNEKYKGDALLQKSFTIDYLTKKKKRNEGEIPQYYVEGAHEAIISSEIFEMVQQEMNRRKGIEGNRYSGARFLSSRIRCSACGGWYGSKVWHSNDKYRREVYQCNNKFRGKTRCQTPAVTEEQVREWFVIAMNKVFENKDEIIAGLVTAISLLDKKEDLQQEEKKLEEKLDSIRIENEVLIRENSQHVMDQDEVCKRQEQLMQAYDLEKEMLDAVKCKIASNAARCKLLEQFVQTLQNQTEIIEEFDESLWLALVECVEIGSTTDVRFIMKDGEKIRI